MPAGGDASGFSLRWLLDPVPVDQFLSTAWEKEPLLVKRGDPGYFASLPSLADVDEPVTATTSGLSRAAGEDGRTVKTDQDGRRIDHHFRLHRDGIPDIQDLYHAYQQGYTVVVNRLHKRSSTVANLARALEADLHHPIGVNLYLTPRAGQGFSTHVDTHDVFILQLHGTKEWHVAEPAGELPLRTTDQGAVEKRPDFRIVRLEPGDTFYLPRGFPHEAVTGAVSSLHLTVGIHAFRWVDLLSEALMILAEDDVRFRHALPPGFLDRGVDNRRMTELTEVLGAALQDASLGARATARLGDKLIKAGKAATDGISRHWTEFRNCRTTPGSPG